MHATPPTLLTQHSFPICIIPINMSCMYFYWRFCLILHILQLTFLHFGYPQTMQDVDLASKADAWSCTLSGGMKRRLSVGIALIQGGGRSA